MLVTRKHIAYIDPSYTTIYWQGIIGNIPCDGSYSARWASYDADYFWRVEHHYSDLPPGSVITVEGVPYSVSGTGVVVHTVGQPTSGAFTTSHVSCGFSCNDDSDCSKGEKCVDGECVPCEKLVDGKGLVTLWGVSRVSDGTIMSDGIPVDISSGVASVQLSNFPSEFLTAGRIQISNGMSGTLTVKAGIGLLASDFGANVTLFSGSVSGHYQDFLFDSGNLPFAYSWNGKITFEILNYDTLGDCADDDVDDTPDDPPIDVVDGGEPQPPGGSGPGTVTPPVGTNTIIKVIVIKPSPPDNGCECEKYLADALYYNFDSLGNRIIDFTNTFDSRFSEQNSLLHSLLSDQNRILFEQLSESNRLSYELSLFFARKLYPQLVSAVSSLQALRDDVRLMRIELESIHDEVESIDDTLRKGLILPECASEPEKGLVEVFDEFSQKYEPVDVVVEESDVWQHTPDEAPRNYPRKL